MLPGATIALFPLNAHLPSIVAMKHISHLRHRPLISGVILLCLYIPRVSNAFPSSFSTSDEECRNEIVRLMAEYIGSSEIVLLHNRWDDFYRSDPPNWHGIRSILSLYKQWRIATLKGQSASDSDSLVLLWAPDTRKNNIVSITNGEDGMVLEQIQHDGTVFQQRMPQNADSRYNPNFKGGENYVRMMFLQHFPVIDKSQLLLWDHRRAGKKELTKMAEDAMTLESDEFLNKYGLFEVFSNQVFRICANGIFQVDFEVADIPTATPPPPLGPSISQIEDSIRKAREQSTDILHLSHEEVSEIVYLAYLLEGKNGTILYEEARRQNLAILLPVDHLQTEIGKRLYDALKERIESIAGNESGS